MCQGEKKFVLEHLYQKNFYIKAQRGYFLFVKVKGLNPYWLQSGLPGLIEKTLSIRPDKDETDLPGISVSLSAGVFLPSRYSLT